jgi:hypothetical protein
MTEMQDLMKRLDKKIRKLETKTTYEIPAISIEFGGVDRNEFESAGLDCDFADTIFASIMADHKFDDNFQLNGYIISHYTHIKEQLHDLKALYESNGEESRQLVITFPPLHCFQYIQFMFRQNEIIVIGNMRSCDFQKKFLMDSYITYRCAVALLSILELPKLDVYQVMNIGSLHIYK